MNLLTRILARRRLAAMMNPQPDYWERRLRAMTPARRARVLANKVLP